MAIIKKSIHLVSIAVICIILIFSAMIPLQAMNSDSILLSKPVSFDTYLAYYQNINSDKEIDIIYPRSSIPAIIDSDQSLIIEFESIPFDEITATLTTSFNSLPDTIPLLIHSIAEDQKVKYAMVSVPIHTPPELYNLTLTIKTDGKEFSITRPRSVCIKDDISDSFTFIHIADFHIGDIRGFFENPEQIIGWKASRKIVEEINLLNPDFIIISGDLTFGQLYPFEYTFEYQTCYEILQNFNVPTYLCPGNHDGYIQTFQDGFKFWQEYFGPLYYSFDYHNTHFLSLNSYDWPPISRLGFSYLVFNWGGSFQDEQLTWIENDLQKHSDSDQIIMMLHHNPLWNTVSESLLGNDYQNQEKMLDLIRSNGIDAVFAGHVHHDNITDDNGTVYVTTTTVSSSVGDDAYWGYRLVTIENGSITSLNYQEPKYSIPSYHINILDQQSTSITIENKLQKAITIQHEFIVPNDHYSVNTGEILRIREKDDMAAVYVSATIDANTTETIMLL